VIYDSLKCKIFIRMVHVPAAPALKVTSGVFAAGLR